MINAASNLDAVRPRRPTGRKGKPQPKSATRRFLNSIRSRAMLLVATSGFSAIMVGIVLNATLFQKGHHPAPLFAPVPAAVPLPVAKPAPVAPAPVALPEVVETVAAPAPAALTPVAAAHPSIRPAAHPTAHPTVQATAPTRPRVAPPATPKHAAAKPHDGISQLLAGSKPAVAHPASARAGMPLRPPAAIPQVIE